MRTLCLIAFCVVIGLTGCMSTIAPLVPPEDRSYQDVVSHSQTKAVAFQRTMKWVAQSFNSANDVVQLSNEEQGSIVLKGVYAANRFGVRIPTRYTLTIDIKDNKTRFTYLIGSPVESDARGPMKYEMSDLVSNYNRLKSSIIAAINTSDDF